MVADVDGAGDPVRQLRQHHGDRLRPWHVAALAAASLPACASFHELPPEADAGADATAHAKDAAHDSPHDTRVDDVGKGSTDALDAAPPPDFACTKAWTASGAAADPRCVGVRTVSLVATGTVTVGGVSMARTSAGRLGIAYDDVLPVDAQGLTVATFLAPSAPPTVTTPLAPVFAKVGYGDASHVGLAHAVAAGPGADLLQLLYVDEDADEVLYAQITGASAAVSVPELVASGVGTGAYVSFAVSGSGSARAVYFVPSVGAVRSAARNAGGGFPAPSELVTGLDPSGAPGVGQSSLFFDQSGTPNVLYEACPAPAFSTPTYTVLGASWSAGETIDNNELGGFSGYSPSLVVSGPDKYASYFFVPTNQASAPVAELHVASWQSETSPATIVILENDVAASDPTDDGGTVHLRFSAALAIDRFGLLHMVVVLPDENNRVALLQYLRQTESGGVKTWLTDTIDPDVLGSDLQAVAPNAFAAIVVDENARPHIAYRSGKDGNVYYATRFDR